MASSLILDREVFNDLLNWGVMLWRLIFRTVCQSNPVVLSGAVR